jgi:predicted anti-sigma-YlaC factor YlaD
MKCRSCRKRVFDYRDGTLSPREIEEVGAHLALCLACREYFEGEEALARSLKGALEAATFAFDPGIRVGWAARPRSVRKPFFKRYPFLVSVGALLLLAAVILGPGLFRNGGDSRGNRPDKPLAMSDDLIDPLQDWLEGRMIITVEDRKTGVMETFASTRSGGLIPLRSERRSR